MKLRVFQDNEPCETEPEVWLKLEERTDCVVIVACDTNGEKVENGDLVYLGGDGKIYRYFGVSKDLGFSLDGARRIRLRGEDE